MARTKGALGKKTIAAQQGAIRVDDYANAMIGVGTRADRSSFSGAKAARILTQWDVENLYMADGLARKVVDLPAEEMTRSGIELEDLEDEALAEYVMSRLDELDAMRHMSDAVRIARMTGGALMIFGLNDGGALDVPLNPEGVKTVDFIRVYDRYQANIKTRVEDPALKEYGQPELWEITPVIGGAPYLVHHSRVHVFDGEFIPERKRQQNNGWGASVYQGGMDQLVRLGMGHQWANMILERSQQAIHKIPKLANTLQMPGGEAMVQKRVDVVDMVRGVLNTVVVDAEEDYDVISTSLANVPDILDRFAEAVSAVFSIPIPVLMGRATGGLGSTDKGTLDAWYARIGSWWNDILRKPEDRLVTFLMMEKGQNKPYKLCMKPLVVMSDDEVAAVEKTKAEAFKIRADAEVALTGANIIDPLEARPRYKDDYDLFATPPDNNPEPVDS
jgi:phage-related protein (TIGR01555 family)